MIIDLSHNMDYIEVTAHGGRFIGKRGVCRKGSRLIAIAEPGADERSD